jgi:hypothetical protein
MKSGPDRTHESDELSRLGVDEDGEDLLERAGEVEGDGIAIRKVISTRFGDAGIDPNSADEEEEDEEEIVDLANDWKEDEGV